MSDQPHTMTTIRGLTKRWQLAEAMPDTEALADALRVSRLTADLLARRGVDGPEAARRFLEPGWSDLHDPALLYGCARAAERIVQALRDDEPIIIYGDYDVDGITATAILHHLLITAKPEARIGRYIPHRIDEGYGLNSETLNHLADRGARLIISVDCGITAIEPAEAMRQRGVDLIITDHHEMADQLPAAHTLVHPCLHAHPQAGPDAPDYPFGELCGAGVAYKLAWQIARCWCGSDRVSASLREMLVHLLPLAALGTVADVVPLVGENRTIAYHGLRHIKDTPLVGLDALIDAAGLRDEKIDAYAVGFRLGPRLNACGRMGHAKQACRMFTTATPQQARQIAEYLNHENQRRRATERAIYQQACQMVAQHGYDRDEVRCIVLGHEDWHAGVVGIVCSRLVETFGRPAILLNTADGQATGSGRSIDGFNLHAALAACSEHLTTFGGHAMAAGLSLPADSIDAFRRAMIDHAAENLDVDDLTPMLQLDAQVALSDLTTPVVEEVQRLAPFGRANPAPTLLLREAQIAQPPGVVGREGKHLTLVVRQGRATTRCIAWNNGHRIGQLAEGMSVDLAARPKLNAYRGRTSVELELLDMHLPTTR